MLKIEPDYLDMLTQALDDAIITYKKSLNEPTENFALLRMCFIHNFAEDIWLLNDLQANSSAYRRTIYLVLRNMVEQLIEFLYLQKNTQYIDEYLGLKIDYNSFVNEQNITKMAKLFGQKRYKNTRPKIIDMAQDIRGDIPLNDYLDLYDLYSILSESCHNSYYESLLNDYDNAVQNNKDFGPSNNQKLIVRILINLVLQEFPSID